MARWDVQYLNPYMAKASDSRCGVTGVYMDVDDLLLYLTIQFLTDIIDGLVEP